MNDSNLSVISATVSTRIVSCLELDVAPESIAMDAPLFAAESEGGLGLDSLAALEIAVAICDEFKLPPVDLTPEVFTTIQSIAEYVAARQD